MIRNLEGTTIIAHSVGTAVKQSADYSSTVVCLEDPRTTERTKKDTPSATPSTENVNVAQSDSKNRSGSQVRLDQL